MVGSGLFFEDADTTKFKIADCSDEIFRNYGGNSGRYDKTTFNANTTSGSNVITGLVYTSFMFVGMPVSGAGIPVGATVSEIANTTSIKISANAIATATGTSIIFTGRKLGTVELDAIQGHKFGLDSTNTLGWTGESATTATPKYAGFDANFPNKVGLVSDGINGTPRIAPETRMVNRSCKYIIKAKNITGIDPSIHQANANFLDGLAGSAYAKALGNPSNAFQVANAVNSTEAVNLCQFASSLASNGYTKLPNGLILQWGYTSTGTSITFPIAFSAACLFVLMQAQYNSTGAIAGQYNCLSSKSATGFTRSAGDGSAPCYWIAVGY
ncbi:MAG: hypothetical protein WCK67_11160 [bacterium]